ncbi:MAG: hypothetical protein LDL39_05405 [Magnetospirillum sp.]|nr:hypothetical protein [Magnetospirillum sp.]
MATLDLRSVQRGLRAQLDAAMELFEVIDELNKLKEEATPEQRLVLDRAIGKLAGVGQRIGDTAGEVGQNIHRLMSS